MQGYVTPRKTHVRFTVTGADPLYRTPRCNSAVKMPSGYVLDAPEFREQWRVALDGATGETHRKMRIEKSGLCTRCARILGLEG